MKVPISRKLFDYLISTWSRQGGSPGKGSQDVDNQLVEEELKGLIEEVNSVDQ